MVSVIYQPADTRFGDLGAGIGAGLASAGQGFGDARRKQAKSDALQAILSQPNQTQTQINQAIVSNPAFADDPQAALAIADSMYQSKQRDLEGARSKIVLNALYKSNPEAFKGVDTSTFDQLGSEQAISLAGHLTDAFAQKQQASNEAKRTDIAQQEATQTAKYQTAQTGLGYAQLKEQTAAHNAELKATQDRFREEHDLNLKKFNLEEHSAAVDNMVKYHDMSHQDAVLAVDQATLAYQKQHGQDTLQLDRDKLEQDATQFGQTIQLEKEKAAAAQAAAEAQTAHESAILQKDLAGQAETARHNLATEAKQTAESAAAAAASSVSDQYGVDPGIAARVIKEQPLLIGGIVGQFKGQYDSGTGSFSFSTAASPADRAQANIALAVSGQNMASSGGDSAKAISQSANDAQQIYASVSKAIEDGGTEQELIQRIVAAGKVTGHNFSGRDAAIIYQQVKTGYDQTKASQGE